MMVTVVLIESEAWLTRTRGASSLSRSDIVLSANTKGDEHEQWNDKTRHSYSKDELDIMQSQRVTLSRDGTNTPICKN